MRCVLIDPLARLSNIVTNGLWSATILITKGDPTKYSLNRLSHEIITKEVKHEFVYSLRTTVHYV